MHGNECVRMGMRTLRSPYSQTPVIKKIFFFESSLISPLKILTYCCSWISERRRDGDEERGEPLEQTLYKLRKYCQILENGSPSYLCILGEICR